MKPAPSAGRRREESRAASTGSQVRGMRKRQAVLGRCSMEVREQEREGKGGAVSRSLTWMSVLSRYLMRLGLLPAFPGGPRDTLRMPPSRIK